MSVFDFIKLICNSLNLDTGACYKIDLYQNIQNEIIRLVKHDKVKPIVIIDDAHNLSREEVKDYIKTRIEYANLNNDIFSPDALSALYSCSKSSPRRLNTLVTNCLMLTSQNKKNIIDSDIVINAKNEMNLD